jgi:hypothetical protein
MIVAILMTLRGVGLGVTAIDTRVNYVLIKFRNIAEIDSRAREFNNVRPPGEAARGA